MKNITKANKLISDALLENLKKRPHWCTRKVDRTNPDYYKSKFGEKLDGGYGHH